MKLIPKNLFKSKKTRSISRSENTSFGSVKTTSSADSITNGISTPTSVLPQISSQLIHAFAKIQSDELSGNTPTSMLPDKIPSEPIQAYQMIQKDEFSGNTPTGMLPEIPSKLIHVFQMIGEDSSTSVLPEIPSELELLLVNGDGGISLQELRDTFDFFDVNHDGKITAEELFNVLTTIGEERCTLEDCRRMIRGVDKNGDGFVCFEDFCLMMEQQR